MSTIFRPRGCSCLKERSRGVGMGKVACRGREKGRRSPQYIQVTLCPLLGMSWRFQDESLRSRYTHGEWLLWFITLAPGRPSALPLLTTGHRGGGRRALGRSTLGIYSPSCPSAGPGSPGPPWGLSSFYLSGPGSS